ncbi:Pleckstrin homology domain [Macleaya cordata]|uniref:Pleckstrin homology domain n=1 Tax=Macleaya cordata TaxID=56857 RepID=A0A200QQL4_MACCD|nr:Pleckstrin homology domain [Macleaya cordata]
MLEDQVAFLLQKYLGNYVLGLNKEALKISVWQGDVELTNMQLKPEALNALKLPVKVKAGFLGSVKIKVPWSRLGQEPVLVYLDRIFLLVEPATNVEGCTEDAVQEAKKSRVRDMEIKLLEAHQQLKSEMNTSWLGSLINTIIGNLKLSITNIHIRYEDLESNPGHPFAAGVTLARLSAVTVDDDGRETFVTGGALQRIQKSAELDRLALYLDSDICPWQVEKPWVDLSPSEWSQVFEVGNNDRKPSNALKKEHCYILQPVTGNAKYSKPRKDEFNNSGQALQKAVVNLDDVTLCLSKNGYRDILKLVENFAAFDRHLRYAHYRPLVPVKSNPSSWWKYAYKAVSDQMKKASGKLKWEQVLRYASLRKRYISLYASLLKSDLSRMVVDDNEEIEKLDRELDIELILQWRMLAHKFVEQSTESDLSLKQQKTNKSWWSLGWTSSAVKDENEPWHFSEEDWERLNKIIGYRESDDGKLLTTQAKGNMLHTSLEVHMRHNASKLVAEAQECLAELSCESLDCSVKLYSETKVFDLKLGSYRLSSPNGLLAESATMNDSLVGVFSIKPFDAEVDWSLVAKASPCYMTYLKDSVDQIIKFFESSAAVSQTIAMETAAAVQMTIDGVKRTAQQQVARALEDHARFFLDLDIAAPKIMIPTNFSPDNSHATKLLLDLGNLKLSTQDDCGLDSREEMDMYLQFNLGLSDVSAFLVDGDYHWSQTLIDMPGSPAQSNYISFLPVIDKCGIVMKLQQIRSENLSYPSTRLAVRLPSLGFHFSPARYHRLMQVAKIFQNEDSENSDYLRPWIQADFEGWLSVLMWKGVGNREAVWQRRYCCLVGCFLYVLESPQSKTYKQFLSLRGKQIYEVPAELAGNVEHILAICDGGQSNNKVVEDVNALILRCDSDDSRRIWRSLIQGAIYRASGSAPITTSMSDTSSDSGDTEAEFVGNSNVMDLMDMERVFITGVLDELKICFSYNHQSDHGFKTVLLAEESRLFEFRAIGGQVEMSIRGKDMLIGTVLKTLEIEDLVFYEGISQPRYLARSFIKSTDTFTTDVPESFYDVGHRSHSSNELTQYEGEENFFEASENLVDLIDSPAQMPANKSLTFDKPLIKPPSFSRVAGLLPDSERQARNEDMITDTLDSFVKAQIVIYDLNSPLYDNIDNRVVVTLATLSFFCYRPTILAILKFVAAINISDENSDASSDKSSAAQQDSSREDSIDDQNLSAVQEPVMKGLLGKGKSRVIFYLTLNMARAEILLMNENGTQLATLSQNNFLTDIKVFPSSFSIKASLGNLKISDDSLPSSHSYFWVCDMRNPGGSSFVELLFTSFSVVDEDYKGYDYSLYGQLSEVRIVYLNRFIQEVISYFMGLVPNVSKDVAKVKDQVTNSEKWFTTSEIDGSPALKLDLSLRKPIIVMPQRTDSLDYLELDVVHITVQNTFQWLRGDKNEMGAVHLEILTVQVEDINLTVGTGMGLGETIIQDVKGLSVVIRRSLRDLLHQIPTTEAAIKIEELKAALSNREYQIITQCALSNFSETPNSIPPLNQHLETSSDNVVEPPVPLLSGVEFESRNSEAWITMTVSVAINLVELCLHSGETRDAALATVQVSGAWLLYKSNTIGEGFLSATLKGFTVVDDREGSRQEFRLAIGKPDSLGYGPLLSTSHDDNEHIAGSGKNVLNDNNVKPIPTMLILDAKFNQSSTSISLCVQRPQLLVALDFLLAVVEFFVPTVGTVLSNKEDDNPLHISDAIILDQPTYNQPSAEFSLSPQRPLIVDDERFDHFVYDGKGGNLFLRDRWGFNLHSSSSEAIIYVGSGKRLQFKNVFVKNGEYLDSCILLGTNSSYSASEDDQVFLERGNEGSLNSSEEHLDNLPTQNVVPDRPTEFIIEFQAIGPELTFYNTSKDVEESSKLSNKLLHAQLDAFCRLVMKGDTLEMTANTLGLTMESNGVRILEPFDTSIKFSNASGKTNIHLAVTDIFMNFSFSILRLFLAVEEDILAFLRMTSKKVTVVCSEFDKVGTMQNPHNDQTYAFWRPRAPPGFAVLGDYLTPLDKPPTKGVLAVNANFARVKRPVSFKLIWSSTESGALSDHQGANNRIESSVVPDTDDRRQDDSCSIWLPIAPPGYVAMGCVVSSGRSEPPSSSALCILASLVSPCSLRDCITINLSEPYSSSLAFWRVDNSVGTFLPADAVNMNVIGRAYELRHIIFRYLDGSSKALKGSNIQDIPLDHDQTLQSERSAGLNSGRRFEAIASFRLIWWNQGSGSRKKLSIWRPLVPPGTVYFGDIAVQGYEPPNTCVVLRVTGDEALFKDPLDFQLVGQIKKQRGTESISFWLPLAPPGFVSLGCIACKGTPKQDDFSLLKCIRSDMVTGGQFSEGSIWDSSDTKVTTGPFSLWTVGNEVGTFLVRSGFRKPPKRFALRLADPNVTSGSDDTVVDAEIRTFSAAVFDDYGGLMVPLFNISLSGVGFSLHGRSENLNSTMSFSLAARSYNDKYDSWEPLVEPVDGFLRYQYDQNSPGAASQLRLTSTRDLNLNFSVSNTNMILQAYASWNNLSHVHESYKKREAVPTTYDGKSIIGFHHKRNYYIIPQNKLGQDIFIRATEIRGLHNIIRMPSGDVKPVKVPVVKNMLDSHLQGKLGRRLRTMVTIIIVDGQLPTVEGLSTHQYTVAIRLVPNECLPSDSLLKEQSARTCGTSSDRSLPSGLELVNWNETFFFKVDSPVCRQLILTSLDLLGIYRTISAGELVGFYSAPLKQIGSTFSESSNSYGSINELNWIELSSARSMKIPQEDEGKQSNGRMRCAILLSPISEENDSQTLSNVKKHGLIQISPTKDGPWTTVKLNYAAPAACWRLGNDVVASEVSVKDGNKFVNIRSLVSISNNTDFILDVCLTLKDSNENMKSIDDNKQEEKEIAGDRFDTDEFFETEKYNPTIGWVGCLTKPTHAYSEGEDSLQEISAVDLPSGWEWVGDWHVDNASVNTADGWVYAPDLERLKWPESYSQLKFVNYARQRKWIRKRKRTSGGIRRQISVGLLNPGDTIPLPLAGLTHPAATYILQLRPWNANERNEYSWSSVVGMHHSQSEVSRKTKDTSEICVSSFSESEELLYCTCNEMSGSSSSSGNNKGLWFCLSIKATEIGKDIRSDPIQDWNLFVKSPLSIINFLPLSAEFAVLELQANGQFFACSRGIFSPGETVGIYKADLRKPLYLSLLPQGGWQPIHDAVLVSHPSGVPSKALGLRSSFSGRIVQVILEQNHDKEQQVVAKIVRIYAPFWIASARCPPLTYRLVATAGRKKRNFPFPLHSKQSDETIVEEISEEEIFDGYTIDSTLNFKLLGLSVSIGQSDKKQFGPVRELSSLGDMDGTVDLYAYDEDGNCIHLFISSKPCPYQSVPTKVISVRPFMTFTNRIGQDIFIKLSSEDEPKVLRTSDSRVSFVYRKTEGPDKLQVRLEDTEWCFPVEVVKEDTIFIVLRTPNGGRRFLRAEIRGYEEGSRFIIVFRLGSTYGPIKVENRTTDKIIRIRQSGLNDDSWIQLNSLSTTNFCWEDPYGERLIDAEIHSGSSVFVQKFSLERAGECSSDERTPEVQFHVVDMGDIMIARFTDHRTSESISHEESTVLASSGNWGTSDMQHMVQNTAAPIEVMIELGVVGVSMIDHRPRELSYLYLERVFISYSTGYDGGNTSRFKLILGHLQIDNQLPLTLMPVLLAPEDTTDAHHPVFKMTITMRNDNNDGTLVYPYVYIRVTEKCWRINIHEPIIWAFVEFYNNLQMDRIPKSSSVTQVDPEIRVDLIDVSEVRLKLKLETAPTQRPHGVLGVWSPILSAVGNAFKIQVHLRKVMHRNRFMRKSSIVPAIVNRIWRDLIHNPLHLIFSVDVLGMTSSTLASLSKGFAELSTDGQFLQLRSKQVWSRRITGVGDGILQGTEALAQGFAFGVSGVVTKPVESARQNGLLGLAHGLGQAFLGFIVQPVSGALDFFSLTVDGIGASCSRCLEVFNNKTPFQRIRNPRPIHADGVLREYCEREATGQMILYLAEASRHFGCTEIFKEPSKYAWSDYYEVHFIVPYQRIVLITNKRVMLLQCLAPDKMDKKPSKIMWDVPWEELMALELAKAGYPKPSHLILHLKNFKRSEKFVRLIKCSVEEAEEEAQAVRICSVIRKFWKAYQADMRCLVLKVPSSQRHVYFSWEEADGRDSQNQIKPMIKPREYFAVGVNSDDRRFIKHTINFQKIWSSEAESRGRCILSRKQVLETGGACSIWRPICPDGYVSIGDIAHVGSHAPNVSAVYHNVDGQFTLPVGYDLVWRNCLDDYATPVSIWFPRAPDGFVSLGCVAVAAFTEPENNLAYCVKATLAEETIFEEQKVWTAKDSYPWACHIYQVQSEALNFVALRQPKEESDWKPMRVIDNHQPSQTSDLP